MKSSILALDVSARACGWAFGLPGDKPASGVERFTRDGDTPDEAFVRAVVWLTSQMTVLAPAIVAIEAPILTSGGGFTNPHTADLLQGIIHCFRLAVKAKMPGRAQLIAASTVRKTFTGKGAYAKGEAKDAVMAECLRRGWLDAETVQPDKADALALWGHMAAQQLPELAFHQPKRRA
jgi:RNase H-fold protein (predicted Holliday junction resolvase)